MSQADDLAQWLVSNKDKKGTPEWNAKAEEYKRAAEAEEGGRKVSPEVQGERDVERLKILATEFFKESQRFKKGATDALENLKALSAEITKAGGQPPPIPEASAQEETDAQREARVQKDLAGYEERMGQLFGAGAGAGLAAGRLGAEGAKSALRGAGQAVAQGIAAAPTAPVGGPAGPVGGPAGPVSPGAPSAPGAPSIMRQPTPGGPPGGPPAGGTGAFNYGKAFGLTDIEAGRALDMSKQPGGASDLIAQRRQSMQKVNELFPGQFQENPRYSGIMTPDQGAGRGPRASFTAGPGAQMRQLPQTQPIPTAPITPKPPSGLEQVTQMFKDMAGKGLRATAGAALRYGAPPLALAGAGGELARGMQEYRKEEPDYTELALSGLGTAGGVLSAFPGTAGLGIPMSLGVPAYRSLREKIAAEGPVKEITPEEEILYRRPSFRMSAPKSRGLR